MNTNKILHNTSNVFLQRRGSYSSPLYHQFSALTEVRKFLCILIFILSCVFVKGILGWVCVVCILLNWVNEMFLSGLNIWDRLKTRITYSKDSNNYVLLHFFQMGHFSVSPIMIVHQIVTDCMKQSQVLSIKPDSNCKWYSFYCSIFFLCSVLFLLWIGVTKDA